MLLFEMGDITINSGVSELILIVIIVTFANK